MCWRANFIVTLTVMRVNGQSVVEKIHQTAAVAASSAPSDGKIVGDGALSLPFAAKRHTVGADRAGQRR
jgi:hypothetical protein